MLLTGRKVRIETERLTLRPPIHADFREWAALRQHSESYLIPWEPSWAHDHLSRKSFTNRVYWARRAVSSGSALPMFLVRRSDQALVGAITLDNIRRGPAQAGTLGYWTGLPYARNGYMREAIGAMVHHAFTKLDLSRKTRPRGGFWRARASNTRAWPSLICKSTGDGGPTCYMHLCATTGGAGPRLGKPDRLPWLLPVNPGAAHIQGPGT